MAAIGRKGGTQETWAKLSLRMLRLTWRSAQPHRNMPHRSTARKPGCNAASPTLQAVAPQGTQRLGRPSGGLLMPHGPLARWQQRRRLAPELQPGDRRTPTSMDPLHTHAILPRPRTPAPNPRCFVTGRLLYTHVPAQASLTKERLTSGADLRHRVCPLGDSPHPLSETAMVTRCAQEGSKAQAQMGEGQTLASCGLRTYCGWPGTNTGDAHWETQAQRRTCLPTATSAGCTNILSTPTRAPNDRRHSPQNVRQNDCPAAEPCEAAHAPSRAACAPLPSTTDWVDDLACAASQVLEATRDTYATLRISTAEADLRPPQLKRGAAHALDTSRKSWHKFCCPTCTMRALPRPRARAHLPSTKAKPRPPGESKTTKGNGAGAHELNQMSKPIWAKGKCRSQVGKQFRGLPEIDDADPQKRSCIKHDLYLLNSKTRPT